MTQLEKLNFLTAQLLKERGEHLTASLSTNEKKRLLRSLMNIRPPKSIDGEFLRIQDEYLKEEIRLKGITDADALPLSDEGFSLWQGDITTLRCGAIVNAANSGMQGCFVPCHGCIDNAIHSFAGVQLRLRCAELCPEPVETGAAIVTEGYNLPCDYIIHTVGPIVYDRLTERLRKELALCYRNCMKAANESGVKSLAFCCISTGEFRFPPEEAAKIAINTVRETKSETKIERVIFNVFKDNDLKIYQRLLALD